ncbi:DUF1493 family protein [Leptonema illini]|uniref:Carrier domain-containing protein n=1 Tax=Leptonema illini DSM 21528 TaxID=929563 RepID=H2CCV9_9LEPT|nr:DUF1493 family protein [Leptonema illini]EHQ06429.1 hypothetical protein Lepil_1746 [Leptonema illini DSM 21528]
MMTMISSAFASLVSEITKVPESDLRGDMDVVYDLGLSGDDFDEFILAYSRRFGVDISSVDWNAYVSNEGIVISELASWVVDKLRGRRPTQPPPLRLIDLDEAIKTGKLIVRQSEEKKPR